MHSGIARRAQVTMLALSLVEFIVNPFEARVLLDDASERLRLPILLNDSLPDVKRREF